MSTKSITETVTEQLQAIEAKAVEAVTTQVEAATSDLKAKVAELEAKVAEAGKAPAFIKPEKTVTGDINKRLKETFKDVLKGNTLGPTNVVLFSDESEHKAYMNEATSLTSSGSGIGGRTDYHKQFVASRAGNTLRDIGFKVVTTGSDYQFRAKTGNGGATYGYPIQNDGAATTVGSAVFNETLHDINCRFAVRNAVLSDVDGLESNIIGDLLAEIDQVEARAWIGGAASAGTQTAAYTGKSLNGYGGSNAAFTAGTASTAAFTANTGAHSIATLDQKTASTATAANITFEDVIGLLYTIAPQNRANVVFTGSTVLTAAIRSMKDTSGAPVFDRINTMTADGMIGTLLGRPYYENAYMDSPLAATGSRFPLWVGAFGSDRGFVVVDRMNVVVNRYDQTIPGSTTFYIEKRGAAAIADPELFARLRSRA